MATRIVCRIGLFRHGVKTFEADVNSLLDKGYRLSQPVDVIRLGLFRYLCLAVLERTCAPSTVH